MGITNCKTHGRVGFVETCAHVAQAIDVGIVPPGHLFRILGNLFVCEGCFTSLGFDRAITLADLPVEESIKVEDGRWDAFEATYDAIKGRRAFCCECIGELDRRA